jgi:hypothetical protein
MDKESVKPLRRREAGRLSEPIRLRLEAWKARGVAHHLEVMDPVRIESLGNRQNDISEPLLAIAELAGEDWLQRLTSALETVLKGSQSDNVSTGEVLLRDIRSIVTERNSEKIFSKDLAAALCEIEGRPWADWNRGTGFKPNDLARQLARYHIHPQKVSIGTEKLQGYRVDVFEDAWCRYCPVPPTFAGTSELSPSLLVKVGSGIVPGSDSSESTRNLANPHEQRRVPAVPEVPAVREQGELWL